MKLIQSIKKLLVPKFRFASCAWESILDSWRFFEAVNHYSPYTDYQKTHLERDIICTYHVIEKGLSMPEFRIRFGIPAVKRLQRLISLWDQQNKSGSLKPNNQLEAAKSVLKAYVLRHSELGINVDDVVQPSDELSLFHDVKGGVIPSQKLAPGDRDAFIRVLLTRQSIRNLIKNQPPCHEVLKAAIQYAIRTPSVCNRQTWRVHVFEGDVLEQIMEIQGGNRGFGHTIPTALIVTSDMRYFGGDGERYQAWVDGGMFSMTLLLTLHAHGIGAVALNWAVKNKKDRALRDVTSIPDYERIIMIIGCGYPREGALCPASQRREVDSIVTFHES